MTVTVTGPLATIHGGGQSGITVGFRLVGGPGEPDEGLGPLPGSIDATGAGVVMGDSVVTDVSGTFSTQLVSNDAVTPPGSCYRVDAATPDGRRFRWHFTTGPDGGTVSVGNPLRWVNAGANPWAFIHPDVLFPASVDVDVAGGGAAGHVNFDSHSYAAGIPFGGYRHTSAALPAEVAAWWKVALAAGAWDIEVVYSGGPACGIAAVRLDGVQVGTIDTYRAATAHGLRTVLSGVQVLSSGVHELRLARTGAHASAVSPHWLLVSHVQLRRTATSASAQPGRLPAIGVVTTADLAGEAAARANADALLIPLAQKAAANGVATLDGAVRLPSAQLPVSAVQRTIVDAKGDLLVGTADDVLARLPVGAAGTVPTARPAATTGVAWEAPAGGPPSGAAGGDLTGTYPNPAAHTRVSKAPTWTAGDWVAIPYITRTGAYAPTLDKLYASTMWLPAGTIDGFAVDVTTAGPAGSVCRVGLYADVNGRPVGLLRDFGTLATTTAGVRQSALPIATPYVWAGGFVWVAAVMQGATTAVNMGTAPGGMSPSTGLTAADALLLLPGVASQGVAVSGALPGSFPSLTGIALAPNAVFRMSTAN